ncbi:MAG: hypothetical protein V3V97_01265 [Hyphomicrobiaceae bacterium]
MSERDELKQMVADLSATVTQVAVKQSELGASNKRLSEILDKGFTRVDARLDIIESKVGTIEAKVDDVRTELEVTRASLMDTIQSVVRR